MVAIYGSKDYSVGRESARVCNSLRFGNLQAFADKVCGDTIRSIWSATRQAGWIIAERIDDNIMRYSVTHTRSEWIA